MKLFTGLIILMFLSSLAYADRPGLCKDEEGFTWPLTHEKCAAERARREAIKKKEQAELTKKAEEREQRTQSEAATRLDKWKDDQQESTLSNSGSGILIENYNDLHNVKSTTAIALAKLVILAGYRCDSVSSASPFLMSRGFNLYCNNFNYSYEIEDKGGRWFVTVD